MNGNQKNIRRRMSDAHETYLQEMFGGYISPGSGNSFANQGDVRMSRYDNEYAFVFEGKSTLAASLSTPLTMWHKIVEQSKHHLPALALRFYLDERLEKTIDLVVISADDLKELLERANAPKSSI